MKNRFRASMKNWLLGEGFDNTDHLVRRLLIERPHLAPALRNPFMADLTAQYLKYHRDELPNTHYDLFQHYIDKRFREHHWQFQELQLTQKDVIATAIEIAQIIYSEVDTGLEISISKLKRVIQDPQLVEKIQLMADVRIARTGLEPVGNISLLFIDDLQSFLLYAHYSKNTQLLTVMRFRLILVGVMA